MSTEFNIFGKNIDLKAWCPLLVTFIFELLGSGVRENYKVTLSYYSGHITDLTSWRIDPKFIFILSVHCELFKMKK